LRPGVTHSYFGHDDGDERLAGDVDALRVGQEHAGVGLAAQDPADWRCDVARRQPRGGHLVEQHLEQMVVLAVDQGDADRLAAQRLGGGETAEAAADDHDMGRGRVGHDQARS
jgi:hypothetical protein